jgi:anti-sigma B factor antagonist
LGRTAQDFKESLRQGKVAAGGHLNGPKLAFEVMQFLLQKRQLPLFLPNDRQYRHIANGLTVEVEELRHAPIAVLHCAGQVTRENAALLEKEALLLVSGQVKKLVVDLEAVTFMDSSGVGAMVAAQRRAHQYNGVVVLCGASKGVSLTLQMLRLDKLFSIYGTQSEAVAALA